MSTFFEEVVARISRLQPGERVVIDGYRLGQGWGGALGSLLSGGFTAADRALENVIGSSVTHRYRRDRNGDVTFERLHLELPEGVRSYVSPDRENYFDRRLDGLYQRHGQSLTTEDEARILCALHGHKWVPAMLMPEMKPMPPCPDLSAPVEETTFQLVEGKRCRHCNVYS